MGADLEGKIDLLSSSILSTERCISKFALRGDGPNVLKFEKDAGRWECEGGNLKLFMRRNSSADLILSSRGGWNESRRISGYLKYQIRKKWGCMTL